MDTVTPSTKQPVNNRNAKDPLWTSIAVWVQITSFEGRSITNPDRDQTHQHHRCMRALVQTNGVLITNVYQNKGPHKFTCLPPEIIATPALKFILTC